MDFDSGNWKVGICQRKPEKRKPESWKLTAETGKFEFANGSVKSGNLKKVVKKTIFVQTISA